MSKIEKRINPEGETLEEVFSDAGLPHSEMRCEPADEGMPTNLESDRFVEAKTASTS